MSLFRLMQLWREVGERLRDERKHGESLIDCLNRVIAEAHEWRKYGASKPQPAPQNQDGPALWPMIIRGLGESELDRLLAADMLSRHEFGVAKYGVPLVASNGRDHLADAYQEALDGVVYLRAATISSFNCTQACAAYFEMLELARRIRALIVARDGK